MRRDKKNNDNYMFGEGNNCKIVYNRIRDTVPPFIVAVTICLYGHEANNSILVYRPEARFLRSEETEELTV
jgi:hypothetical protein